MFFMAHHVVYFYKHPISEPVRSPKKTFYARNSFLKALLIHDTPVQTCPQLLDRLNDPPVQSLGLPSQPSGGQDPLTPSAQG